MRGKALTLYRTCTYKGIPPAYAGKSCDSTSQQNGYKGSPPPMRGKAFPVTFLSVTLGITPAYAGKS